MGAEQAVGTQYTLVHISQSTGDVFYFQYNTQHMHCTDNIIVKWGVNSVQNMPSLLLNRDCHQTNYDMQTSMYVRTQTHKHTRAHTHTHTHTYTRAFTWMTHIQNRKYNFLSPLNNLNSNLHLFPKQCHFFFLHQTERIHRTLLQVRYQTKS